MVFLLGFPTTKRLETFFNASQLNQINARTPR